MGTTDKRRVLIAGGGVAALEAMIALRQLAEERVDLTLVAPDKMFTYRPLAVAEPFDVGSIIRVPLETLTSACGARFEQAAVTLVDPEEHTVYTSRGRTFEYDALVLGFGASTAPGLPGAITFGGSPDGRAIRMLIEDMQWGLVHRVVFAIPTGIGWTLPLYELALLTSDRARREELRVEIVLCTPEEEPLATFGAEASRVVRSLLEASGIILRTSVHSRSFDGRRLEILDGPSLDADQVITLPRLVGRYLEGVPQDADDFIPVDPFGRVDGLRDVYAAGDITNFPVKQGGIAAQQAVAVAETIAAGSGAPVSPKPFEPVLRGLLLTGGEPVFLRAEIAGGHGETSVAYSEPLWWPAGKIAARYLAPFLAEYARSPSGSRYEPSRLLV